MTFEEDMNQSIKELVNKKIALEKRIFELEKEKFELQEENEQLNNELQDYQFNYDNIKELSKEIAELKAEINQLSNDNHVLKTSFIIQKEKIEKMKTLFEIIKNRSCTVNIYNIAVEGMELAE